MTLYKTRTRTSPSNARRNIASSP